MFKLVRLLNRKRLLYKFESPPDAQTRIFSRGKHNDPGRFSGRSNKAVPSGRCRRVVAKTARQAFGYQPHQTVSLLRQQGRAPDCDPAEDSRRVTGRDVCARSNRRICNSSPESSQLCFCKFAVSNEKEYFFLFSDEIENTRNSKAYLKQRQALFNFIVEIAKDAQVKGQTDLDGRTLANLAWATMHGLFLLHFRGQFVEGRSFEDLFESAMSLLFGPAKDEASGSSGRR